jgi:hypothetical protein
MSSALRKTAAPTAGAGAAQRPLVALHRRPSVAAGAGKQTSTTTTTTKQAPPANQRRAVQYGNDWYAATREAARPNTMREELARRKAVNDVAYRDRRLNSDAWEGSEYKGSRWNILTFLAALFVLVPVLGLGFAYQTYGVLWG